MTQLTSFRLAKHAVNDNIAGVLQRKCACGNTADGLSRECENCAQKKAIGLQRQLTIGRSDDPLEREADRVAAQVMRGRSGPVPVVSTAPRLSRFSTRQPNQSAVAPPSVQHVLEQSGEPLSDSSRALFEPRFGHDFGQVRVHRDAAATSSAREVDAHAYTVGRNVVFGQGRYTPDSRAGRELLAHELAHVVQQDGVASRAQARAASEHPPILQRRSIWEGIAGLFRGDDFSENELTEYLDLLDRTGAIEDFTESDNKARAVVRHWKRGDSLFLLTPARKILLIREMFSGFTGDDDELAILDLLRGSENAEFNSIITTIGEAEFHSQFHGAEQDQFDALLASRQGSPTNSQAVERARTETLTPELALDLQRRFTSNAESTNRLNCIEIVRDIAPRLFADEPEVAERVRRRLARLRGGSLTMPDLGRAMSELGLASAYRRIRFNNGNGRQQPTEMQASAWDAIIEMVGDVPGWHIFGLAVFDGYHSITVLVDNRPDGPRLYWADQWRIDPGDDFHEEEGSASGFRRYEQAGLDRFLNEYTESRWLRVFEEKGKRYDATLHIWKFRSRLSQPLQERSGRASPEGGESLPQRKMVGTEPSSFTMNRGTSLASLALQRPGKSLDASVLADLTPWVHRRQAEATSDTIDAADTAQEKQARRVEDEVLRAGINGTHDLSEPSPGAIDFSDVRIHTDDAASLSARAMNAAAYTIGPHIAFAPGRFSPRSREGRALLAHELTHVAQQRAASRQHIVQPRLINDYGEIESRLSYSIVDWAITDQEARDVLQLLAQLSETDLADTVAAMDRDGLIERLLDNVATEDRERFAVLIAQIIRRRSVARSAERIVDRLSYGLFDWAITDQDARDALQALLGLEPQQLRTVVGQLVNTGTFDRLMENLPEEDHRRFAAFIERLRRIRDGFSALVSAQVAFLRSRPGGAGRTVRERVRSTGYGGSRSTWGDLDAESQNDWRQRAREAIAAVTASLNGTDLEAILERSELVFRPEDAERLHAYAYVSGGNRLFFGRSWVTDAEEDVRNVWQSIAHELGGHEEFGTTWSWQIMRAAVAGLTPEERTEALRTANSLYSAYGYLETEIYAELREAPYRISTSGGDKPEADVPRQLERLRDAFGPVVSRQLALRLYYRVLDDPRVTPGARRLLYDAVQQVFSLFPIAEPVQP